MSARLFPFFVALLILPVFMTGCSSVGGMFGGGDDEKPLEGERISILELERKLEPDAANTEIKTGKPWRNEYWPQAGGYPSHAMQHLAFADKPPSVIWEANIGRGSTDELPLTAQPVVIDGLVFTLDTDSRLSAFNIENGRRAWEIDVRDPAEDDPVIGGGLAYSRGRLYVTNGYDELIAVNPRQGAIAWRVKLPAPSRAAPTIIDGRVFVTTLDNRLIALDAEDGTVLWDFTGISETAGLIGAASPAANREIVVPGFSSGEVFALRVENGTVAWAENLASLQQTGGLSALSDIRGLPVIDKGLVIAISFGGRIAAIEERSGLRIWSREIGGSETPWVAENTIFIVSTDNEAIALRRTDGAIHWVTPLPRYRDPKSKKDNIFWTGPVLAGGRLIFAGTNGRIAELDPQTGNIMRRTDIGGAYRIAPVVAGETLYLLAEDGTLAALR